MIIFLCLLRLYMSMWKPCSLSSPFRHFSGKFPDCCCTGFENIQAVTKAPAVSAIIPCASPCTASPSKERWLLGTPLGTGLEDGKWAWKKSSSHASKTQLVMCWIKMYIRNKLMANTETETNLKHILLKDLICWQTDRAVHLTVWMPQ